MQNKNLQNLLKKVNDETANLPITHQESELIILNNESSSALKGGWCFINSCGSNGAKPKPQEDTVE